MYLHMFLLKTGVYNLGRRKGLRLMRMTLNVCASEQGNTWRNTASVKHLPVCDLQSLHFATQFAVLTGAHFHPVDRELDLQSEKASLSFLVKFSVIETQSLYVKIFAWPKCNVFIVPCVRHRK